MHAVKDSSRAGSSVSQVWIPITVAPDSYGMSKSRLYLLMAAGEIEHRKVGRRTLLKASSLDDYIERQPPAALRRPKAA